MIKIVIKIAKTIREATRAIFLTFLYARFTSIFINYIIISISLDYFILLD